MSETNKNRKTILFGTLIIVVLVGICFFCVTLYAKREISKPKFNMPDQPEQPAVTALPTDKDAAYVYVSRLYETAVQADNVEGSWYTDVRTDGTPETPFSESDNAILHYIRDHAKEQVASFYPSVADVRMTEAQDVPQLGMQQQDVLGFTAEQGQKQDDGTIRDADCCFVTLTIDPASADTAEMTSSEVFRSIASALSSAAELYDTQIKAQSVTMRFVIDRLSDHLLSVEIERDFLVDTAFRLTEDAAALLPQREARIVLPYGTTQHIRFVYYGARFTQRAIVVKPNDMKALPAEISVRADATKADYTLTFTSSDPDVLSFDADGVMTVGKDAVDESVTVTMTLEYEGHTYTDQLTVYISEWEVATDVGA